MPKPIGLFGSHSTQANAAFAMMVFLFAFFASGCGNVIRRGQSPDESLLKLSDRNQKTNFIGQICGVRGLRPAPIEGIGLVVGLEATGSEPPPSSQRDYLLKELKSNKTTPNPKQAMASKNTSLVLVRGWIPAAAKKGEVIDLEVLTPERSDTTSLKYGELLRTDLRPMASLGRSVKLGNINGRAKGSVIVDALFESGDDERHELKGRILGGGELTEDRPMTLVVHSEDTSVKTTRSIAHAINRRYDSRGSGGRETAAKPITDRIIQLEIPEEYEHNLGRYIQSLQAMAFAESKEDRIERLKDLDRRIADPETARRAAVELEAIGPDALPILNRAMQHPDFEVRFYVAEALAYMGESIGIDHLVLAAKKEPAFRWHALTALASVKKTVAENALVELFDVPSAETRYGAFRALSVCAPKASELNRQKLSDEFDYHEIGSKADCLLHLSRTKNPEIVIFGNERVSPNFLYVEAGLTIKALGDSRVQISRFNPVDGPTRLTCSSSITEMIRALTRMGVDYTTLVEMFRESDGNGTLNARLVVNAAPRIGSKSMQDSVARESGTRSEKYISDSVPELFSDIGTDSQQDSKLEF